MISFSSIKGEHRVYTLFHDLIMRITRINANDFVRIYYSCYSHFCQILHYDNIVIRIMYKERTHRCGVNTNNY